VSEEDARRCLVPSGTSLLWLVKHLTAVEWAWFLYSFAGESAARPGEPVSGAGTIDGVLIAYRPMIRRCNGAIAAVTDLSRPGVRSSRETAPPSLRWIVTHMIEETAGTRATRTSSASRSLAAPAAEPASHQPRARCHSRDGRHRVFRGAPFGAGERCWRVVIDRLHGNDPRLR